MSTALLIIDPQRDFTTPTGALFVPGADSDMLRLKTFITTHKDTIDDIYLTYDHHQEMHIAHPGFWVDSHGNHPEPFTIITYADAVSGRWTAVTRQEESVAYLRQLESHGKHHTIWPLHCIVDTDGHGINSALVEAINDFYLSDSGGVLYFHKGDCPYAEHFSALKAEVTYDEFPETQLNIALLTSLRQYDSILLAGECADVCVRETVRDLCTFAPDLVSKMTILVDCMSPINSAFAITNDAVYAHALSLGATHRRTAEF